MLERVLIALVLAGCASPTSSRILEPAKGPDPVALPRPSVEAPPAASPPPVCDVDAERLFSPDGSRLVVAHETGDILVYDTSSWTVVAILPTARVARMFFVGRHFAFVEEVDTKKYVFALTLLDESFRALLKIEDVLSGSQAEGLGVSPDGRWLAVGVVDSTRTSENQEQPVTRVELWDVAAKKVALAHPLADGDAVQSLRVSKEGHVLLGAEQLSVILKGAKAPVKSWEYRPDPAPHFSPDGSFVTFRNDNVLYAYGIKDKKLRNLKDPACDGQGAV